jgi:hypothetical protein
MRFSRLYERNLTLIEVLPALAKFWNIFSKRFSQIEGNAKSRTRFALALPSLLLLPRPLPCAGWVVGPAVG